VKISVSKSRNSLVTWLLVLAMVGFPLAATIVGFAGTDTRSITIPYRILVFSLATLILLTGLLSPLRGKPSVILLLFFCLYFFRLFYDTNFANNQFAPDALQFFLVATMMPAFAIALTLDHKFDEALFASRLLLAAALSVVGYNVLIYTGRISPEYGARASLTALNPIALGHVAATACIAATYIAMYRRKLVWILIAVLTLTISLPTLIAAGSRGPMVALAAALIWFGMTNKKRALVIIPALTLGAFLLPQDALLIERFRAVFIGLDLSSLARLELQEAALADFMENPFFGKHFMDASFGEGSWPHNYFLEAAMAMGVPGLVLASMLVIGSFKAAVTCVNQTNPLLVALLVQTLVAAQFSGSLFGNEKLFALFSAVLALEKLNKRQAYVSNEPREPNTRRAIKSIRVSGFSR
tara:strand:- start:27 stop:1262 length:1236 start_codon:yes stop_codon:yes gene_type:complete